MPRPLRLLWWISLVVSTGFAAFLLPAPSGYAATGWRSPVTPMKVTRSFEPPPTVYAAGHRGVDLAGAPGERVGAAAAGTVTFAGRIAGRGVIVVSHGLLRTTYEPVEGAVARGDRVILGQLIGRLDTGHAGCPAAACLHWGLLRGDVYLDPLTELSPPIIRLLPPQGSGVGGAPVAEGAAAQAGNTATEPPARLAAAVRPALPAGPSPAAWSFVIVAGLSTIMLVRRK